MSSLPYVEVGGTIEKLNLEGVCLYKVSGAMDASEAVAIVRAYTHDQMCEEGGSYTFNVCMSFGSTFVVKVVRE